MISLGNGAQLLVRFQLQLNPSGSVSPAAPASDARGNQIAMDRDGRMLCGVKAVTQLLRGISRRG